MFAYRLRRWANIKTALRQRIVSALTRPLTVLTLWLNNLKAHSLISPLTTLEPSSKQFPGTLHS